MPIYSQIIVFEFPVLVEGEVLDDEIRCWFHKRWILRELPLGFCIAISMYSYNNNDLVMYYYRNTFIIIIHLLLFNRLTRTFERSLSLEIFLENLPYKGRELLPW